MVRALRPAASIALRECAASVRTPIGWVVAALFALLSGVWVSFVILEPGEPASMRAFFQIARWMLLAVAPALSMKAIADELRSGTIEPLRTSPAGAWSITFGKLAGVVGVLALVLAPSLAYVLVLMRVADPELGPIVSGYVGLLCVGAAYLSAGVFFSSLTQSQVVAFLATVFFFLLAWTATELALPRFAPQLAELARALSFDRRNAAFARGVVDLGDVMFFLAFCAWFGVLTVISLEVRRWR